MIDILSFGGGVGTWGYAAYVKMRKIKKPWLGIIVDTCRECPSTWAYMNRHIHQLDFPLVIVRQSEPALWTKKGDFMPGGYDIKGTAFLRGFCSGTWKRDVARRYLVKKGRITKYNLAFGIHADEFTRMRKDRLKSVHNIYPLVELGLTREDCKNAAIEIFGEEPPRSRCWMCPGQHRHDWEEIARDFPTLYTQAMNIDSVSRGRVNITLFGSKSQMCANECFS